MRVALANNQIPPAPEFFGQLKPARAALGGSVRAGKEHDNDMKVRDDSDSVEEDDPDADSDEAKSLDLLSNPVTPNHPMGRLVQSLFKHSGGKSADEWSQAGGGTPAAKPSHRPSGGRRVNLGRRIASAAASLIAGKYTGDARYPEWDESAKRYRNNWVTVHELEAWNPDAFRDHAALARIDVTRAPTTLSRSLARHVLEVAPHGRGEFGEQLHTDGVVDLAYWRRNGSGSPPLPFIGKKRQRPGVAALVLLDVSSSTLDTTAGVDGDTGSVFDQHLKLSYRITTALDALGVPVGLYAFRSWGRDMVHVMPIKALRESPSALTIERIGHLSPAGFTRIGGAVRHCTAILERQTEGMKRVVILVSDGHPYDDGYDGSQASGDTRHAMSEARLRGVGFVCVGVTAPNSNESHDQGAALDSASALHVSDISGIERQLGKLIRQALADTRRRGDHIAAMPA
jgi:nitric oxide reductase activation protein